MCSPQAAGSAAPALQLAALLAGAWHAAAANDAAAPLLTVRSPASALAALPHALPALLRLEQWRPAAGAVAQRLAQLLCYGGLDGAGSVSALEGRRGQVGGMGPARAADRGADAVVRGAAAACLVAMRELLPDSGWQQVALVALDAFV